MPDRPCTSLLDERSAAPRLPARGETRPTARGLLAGGPEGNERLTVLTGLMLIVLLAALGVTIVRIGQLLWLHLFLGLVLIGPVALKLASTGYRFARYYTDSAAYRRKGPPATPLRMLAPLVVLCTLGVFATGVVLLALGPSSRQPLLLLHKVFFFGWLAVTAVHVLGHAPEMLRALPAARATRRDVLGLAPVGRPPTAASGPSGGDARAGAGARAAAVCLSAIAGLVLALALTGQFHVWT